MGEVGCLKDGHFQNLQVENTTILDIGNITISGASDTVTIPGTLNVRAHDTMTVSMNIKNTLSSTGVTVGGALGTAGTNTTPDAVLLSIQQVLSGICTGTGTDCAISAAHATALGFPGTPQKSNGWLADMITADTVTVINNSGSTATAAIADDSDIGNVAGGHALIVFGEDVSIAASAALTQTITGDDVLQISEGSELMFNTAVGVYKQYDDFSRGSSAGATDEKVILTNAATGTAVIKAGSFIYFYSAAAGSNKDYLVKSVILSDTSLVTPSIAN